MDPRAIVCNSNVKSVENTVNIKWLHLSYVASIAYSKLNVTNRERYGQRIVERALFIGPPNTVFGTR